MLIKRFAYVVLWMAWMPGTSSAQPPDRMTIQTNGFVGIGTASPDERLHVNGNVKALGFVTSSDRNLKENIAPVSPADILAQVEVMPIAMWSFRDEPGSTHPGPMAQDFHAASGLGQTDTGIVTVDADGVALAAIQALAQKVRALEEQNARLRSELETIKNQQGASR